MRGFILGSVFGALLTGITLAWAATVEDHPCMHDGSGCVTTIPPEAVPQMQLDHVGVVMAARSKHGKAVVIQADDDGYVICSPQSH